MRAATVAGGAAVAYHAGKKHEDRSYHEADQDAQLDQMQQQQAAPAASAPAPAAAAPGGLTEESVNRLKQLGQLHDQGILSDQEFEAEKRKILNG